MIINNSGSTFILNVFYDETRNSNISFTVDKQLCDRVIYYKLLKFGPYFRSALIMRTR